MIPIGNLLQALRITPTPSTLKDLKSAKTSPLELTEKVVSSKECVESLAIPLNEVTNSKKDVESRVIPLSEVAFHDDYSDCWIVIYDRVYDVTKFLRKHPGGEDVIMDYAGRDATLAFRGTGHSRDATEMLKEFLIGVLPEEECIFRRAHGGVFLTDVPE